MISIVITGRNDNYEADFLARLELSLRSNVEILERHNIPYEYIVVEWCPYQAYLSDLPQFADIFAGHPVYDVIIDKSVSDAEGLNPKAYYEYYAKNVGIRLAKYDNLLVFNSDLILTPEMVEAIKTKLVEGLDPKKFYRARYRVNYHPRQNVGDKLDLHMPTLSDAVICGAYSGDFLLGLRSTIIDVGRGYDESCEGHRRGHQTGMDAEILWNMYAQGVTLDFINAPYLHIFHGKNRAYANSYRERISYENKPDWGFVKYPMEQLSEKVSVIRNLKGIDNV